MAPPKPLDVITACNRALAWFAGLQDNRIPSVQQMREAREVCTLLMGAVEHVQPKATEAPGDLCTDVSAMEKYVREPLDPRWDRRPLPWRYLGTYNEMDLWVACSLENRYSECWIGVTTHCGKAADLRIIDPAITQPGPYQAARLEAIRRATKRGRCPHAASQG